MIITNQNLVSNSKGLKISHCTKCNNAFYNTSNYCNTYCNTLIFCNTDVLQYFAILLTQQKYLNKHILSK